MTLPPVIVSVPMASVKPCRLSWPSVLTVHGSPRWESGSTALSCTIAEFAAPAPSPIVSTVPAIALSPAVFPKISVPSLTDTAPEKVFALVPLTMSVPAPLFVNPPAPLTTPLKVVFVLLTVSVRVAATAVAPVKVRSFAPPKVTLPPSVTALASVRAAPMSLHGSAVENQGRSAHRRIAAQRERAGREGRALAVGIRAGKDQGARAGLVESYGRR